MVEFRHLHFTSVAPATKGGSAHSALSRNSAVMLEGGRQWEAEMIHLCPQIPPLLSSGPPVILGIVAFVSSLPCVCRF
jgi:hypothetical protein